MAKKKIDIQINVDTKDAVDGIDDVNNSVNESADSFDNLSDSTGAFGGSLGKLKAGFSGLKKGLSAAKLGFTGLKGAIAATGIGILLLAFTSLVAFFTKTKKGAELLEQATAALGAVFGVLTDKLAFIGEALIDIFSNPKQALIDLGNLIQENITNRIKAFGIAGKAILKILSGDFKEGLKELGNATLQFSTGVEDVIGKVQELASSASEGLSNLSTQISNAAAAGLALQKRQQALNDEYRQFGVEQAGIMDRIDRLKQLSDDQTKSEEERIAFLQKGAAIENQIATKRLRLAQEQVDIIKAQNAISDSSAEDLQKQADAEIVLAEARAQSAKISTELAIKEGNIRKQVEDARVATIRETQDIINEILDDGSTKQIERIKLDSERKLSEIKGNGDEEIALRLAIEEKANKDIQDIRDADEAVQVQQELDFLTRLTDLRLDNLSAGYEKESALLAEKLNRDRQAVIDDVTLTEEQKSLLLNEIQIKNDEAQALIDENNTSKKEENKNLLSKENEDKANEAIASAQATVELANSVNDALNAVSDLRVQTRQNETDKSIKLKRAELNDGKISQEQFDKFEKSAKLKQAKFVDKEAEKAFKRNKALSIATTAINTAAAVVNALATLPYPASLVAAIAAGVTGAASIATIASKKFKSSLGGGGGGGGASAPSVTIPNLSAGGGSFGLPSVGDGGASAGPVGTQTTLVATDGSATEVIGGGIAGIQQGGQPIQAYVSEIDITNTQNNISNIEQNAEIGGGN